MEVGISDLDRPRIRAGPTGRRFPSGRLFTQVVLAKQEVRNCSTRESFALNVAQRESKHDRNARPVLPTPHKSCGARNVVR